MIICCGEALVDMLPDGDGHTPVLGGSIFNTARVCGRLGLETAYVAPLSTDQYGDQLAQSLANSGVSLTYVKRVDRPTALAWVTLSDGQAQYRFEMDGSASQMLTRDELPRSIPECKLAHFGSISLASEPCASAYIDLMNELSSEVLVSIDPNIRPAFIEKRLAHQKRLESLFERADIIKLSDEDLEWFGVDADSSACDAFVSRWLDENVALVIVTRGGKGVTGFCNAGRVDMPAMKVKVRDTVGAGDSFSAGIYHGIHSTVGLTRPDLNAISLDNLETILRSGAQISAQVVQQEGAELPRGFQA